MLRGPDVEERIRTVRFQTRPFGRDIYKPTILIEQLWYLILDRVASRIREGNEIAFTVQRTRLTEAREGEGSYYIGTFKELRMVTNLQWSKSVVFRNDKM